MSSNEIAFSGGPRRPGRPRPPRTVHDVDGARLDAASPRPSMVAREPGVPANTAGRRRHLVATLTVERGLGTVRARPWTTSTFIAPRHDGLRNLDPERGSCRGEAEARPL